MSDGEFPAIDGNALGELCSVMIDRATVSYLLGSVKWLSAEERYFGDLEDIYETTQAFEQFARRLMAVTNESECLELVVIPTGSIQMYAGTTAPDGWLLCNGLSYLKADYPDLWSVLGTNFESDSTHFHVPEMLRTSPIGYDPNTGDYNLIGTQLGSPTHTLSVNEMPSHTHVQDAHNHNQNSHNHTQNSHNHTQNSHTHPSHSHGINTQSGTSMGNGTIGLNASLGTDIVRSTNGEVTPAATATNIATTATNIATTATNQPTGGGQAHNIVHPVTVVNYIIKT